MPGDPLSQQVEAFVAWGTDPDDAIPIVRNVDPPDFHEFKRQCHGRLDELAKQGASEQDDVPNWIGAAHPRAPWNLRRKLEILEMEWRVRNT